MSKVIRAASVSPERGLWKRLHMTRRTALNWLEAAV
jgi:hypothetical protein